MKAYGVILLILAPAPALAAPPLRAPAPTVAEVTVTARRATAVEGVDVHGDWCAERRRDAGDASLPPPRVVDSWPRPGAEVAAGPLTLRLTFDQPMNCYWAIDYTADTEFCDPVGVWDMPARRTWTMRCRVKPGQAYALRFYDEGGFRSRTGVEAATYQLAFTTTDQDLAAAGDPGSGETVAGRLSCRSHRRFFGLRAPCRYAPLRP